MDSEGGTCVITSQKFAKGTRFGPLLAEKSYMPVNGVAFPLTIFKTPLVEIAELEPFYNSRNSYLDTRDENKCNWMIHVNTANFSNEQNLNAYQHNDSIYYVAIQDIELGDILKVWYSPMYASRMGVDLLKSSPYDICNNLLRQVSMDYGLKIDDIDPSAASAYSYSQETATTSEKDREIALPPVISLMKISSPNYVSSYSTAVHNAPAILSPVVAQHVFDLNATGHQQLIPPPPPFEANTMYDCGEPMVGEPLVKRDLMDISMAVTQGGTAENGAEMDVGAAEGQGQDVGKLSCEVCSRKYATIKTLERHLRTHDLFLCVTCDKV